MEQKCEGLGSRLFENNSVLSLTLCMLRDCETKNWGQQEIKHQEKNKVLLLLDS